MTSEKKENMIEINVISYMRNFDTRKISNLTDEDVNLSVQITLAFE